MPDVPGWDEEIHASIKALVHLVGDRLDLCTTGVDQGRQVRQVAAAYLARVRRLLMGMDVLYEAEMPDLIGGLLRICLEAWVTGMWVIAVGDETLDILNAHYVFRNNLIIENAELGLQALDPVDDAPHLPHVEKRFQAVEEHLVADGDANIGEVVRWAYRVVYAAESNEAIHAGYASVLGHTVERPQWWGIRQSRYESGDGAGKVLWAATLVAMLARRVFPEFSIGIGDLDEAAAPIQRLAVYLNDNPPEGTHTPP
jgi:hypothetical protein